MSHNIYIYILVMAGVSYLIRNTGSDDLPGNPVRDRKCLVCMGSSDRCHSTCMVWEKPAASIRMRMHGGVPVRIVFVKWKNWQNKKLFYNYNRKSPGL